MARLWLPLRRAGRAGRPVLWRGPMRG